jgi:hypothetical protein
MKALLSDDLWQELSKHTTGYPRLRAAIAYVTAPHLDFSRGDILVCDASDNAIKGCLTSAPLLRTFFDHGAELYSYEGLHSKVAVIDNKAVIGSANLSENASVSTCEAVLLTHDLQVVGLVQGFIEKVKNEAEAINEEFLNRIEAIPVVRKGGWSRKSKKKIAVGTSRVWLISTKPMSDKLAKAEEKFVEIGTKEAEKYLKSSDNEPEPIRWHGKSKFRSEAKGGDLIVQVFTERRGKRKFVEVYRPAPILLRQDEQNWTRFYIEVPKEQVYYAWKEIKADFKSLGVTNITPNSTRELTGKALGILQLME